VIFPRRYRSGSTVDVLLVIARMKDGRLVLYKGDGSRHSHRQRNALRLLHRVSASPSEQTCQRQWLP
jgi:hypothetical protein